MPVRRRSIRHSSVPIVRPCYGLMLAATAYPFGVTFASGFQLFEQSVSSIATAGANQAAPDDATTAFYNPAAMVRLRGAHLSIAGTLIKPTGHFSVTEAQTVAPPPDGIPIAGGSGGDPGSYNFLPSLFYTQAITDRLSVGLAMTSPFGLSTHYDNGWVGRYHALDSELATYEIAPQIAYALNEQWSLGFGVSAQYAKAKLSNAIDFSTVCLGVAAQVDGFGAVCAASGLLVPGNQATDGLFSLKGTSWAYGWNAAVSYRATPTTKFGATYRSRLVHDLSADATFEKPASLPALIAGQAAFTNGTARTEIELPETVTLSATTAAFRGLDTDGGPDMGRVESIQRDRDSFRQRRTRCDVGRALARHGPNRTRARRTDTTSSGRSVWGWRTTRPPFQTSSAARASPSKRARSSRLEGSTRSLSRIRSGLATNINSSAA